MRGVLGIWPVTSVFSNMIVCSWTDKYFNNGNKYGNKLGHVFIYFTLYIMEQALYGTS